MTQAPARKGPLDGVRIVDLTAVVLGPLATQILGDYGADIVKVEPLTGDVIRYNGLSVNRGMSSVFIGTNRNKQSIALDLKHEDGVRTLRRLIAGADIFIHNMRIEALERLGFGYESVRKLKDDIVYCVATGFGQEGPYKDQPAFDDIIQAGSGLIGFGSDTERHYVPSLIADKTAGLALVNAVLAALFHRERSGEGQYVEVPMLETLAAFVLVEHMGGMAFDPPAGPAGYARLLDDGRKPVKTTDGFVAMLPYTGNNWVSFLNETGQPHLIEELGVVDPFTRNANVPKLYAKVQEYANSRTTQQLMDFCRKLDIPATPIYRVEELPEHPHLKSVGLFQTQEHPTEGRLRYVRPATLFSRTPATVRNQAPVLGQDSIAILEQSGFGQDEIDRLLADGVVKQAKGVPRD